MAQSPAKAVESRHIAEFNDLTWMRQGGTIEVELWLDFSDQLPTLAESLINYRIAIKQDQKLGVCVDDEILRQYSKSWLPSGKTIEFSPKVKPKRLLGKTTKGTDSILAKKGLPGLFNFGLDKLALALTPPDDERYRQLICPTFYDGKGFATFN